MISAVPLDFPDTELEAALVSRLALVESSLRAVEHPEDALLTEVSRHLMTAGGKRFRALLVLLAAEFGDACDPRVIQAAVAIELTHLATLFHDDVMDEAAVRRGSDTVNARWGNSVAILAGDFLFAQASLILAGLGPDAVRLQAQTFNRLVTGQLAETIGPRPGESALDHYLFVIAEKTGSLIATSGLFGAMYSGAPDSVTVGIARACEELGIAWQLSDDLIDVASESAESGKTPGTDLREGVPTLPVLYALRSADEADSRLLWLLGPEADLSEDSLLSEAIGLLRRHHAMIEARTDILSYANNARSLFMALPDVPARAAFLAMCDYVVKRTSLTPPQPGPTPPQPGPPPPHRSPARRSTAARPDATFPTFRICRPHNDATGWTCPTYRSLSAVINRPSVENPSYGACRVFLAGWVPWWCAGCGLPGRGLLSWVAGWFAAGWRPGVAWWCARAGTGVMRSGRGAGGCGRSRRAGIRR